MFIGCENSTGYNDYYYIENIETIEELQSYVQNKMPVIGKRVDHRYNRSAVLSRDTRKTLIYLNNYYNIYKANLYFIDEEEFDKLNNEKCKTCTKFDDFFGCLSSYKPDEINLCANYKEPKYEVQKKWYKFWR